MSTRGFLFDLNRCTGCQACILACRIENGIEDARGWREVHTFNGLRCPGLPTFHLSLACNHCAAAPCMESCPALAYTRDSRTAAVLLRHDACIGCRYCLWACPFDVPRYDPRRRVMSKCTWCNDRLLESLKPACVTSCPTGALEFGSLESLVLGTVPGFPRTEFDPSIRFRALLLGATGPECTAPAESLPEIASSPVSCAAKTSLQSEWPIIGFTLGAALLVAFATGAALGGMVAPRLALALGAVGLLGIGSLHLRRKLRAWRALLNLRGSWLSRELAGYLAFVLSLAAPLVPALAHPLWDSTAVALGFVTLYSIDRVYGVASARTPTLLHSASVWLTGTFLSGIVAGLGLVAGIAGALKLCLYAWRKRRIPSSLTATVFRVALPALGGLSYVSGTLPGTFAFALVLAGELIDRAEYYLGLEFESVRRSLAVEMRKSLQNRLDAAV